MVEAIVGGIARRDTARTRGGKADESVAVRKAAFELPEGRPADLGLEVEPVAEDDVRETLLGLEGVVMELARFVSPARTW